MYRRRKDKPNGLVNADTFTVRSMSTMGKFSRLGILAAFVFFLTLSSVLRNRSLIQKYPLSRYREINIRHKTAIAALVPNTEGDMFDFCLALKSLKNLPSSRKDAFLDAPILLFHEGDIDEKYLSIIKGCTDRPMSFPKTDFSFPEGFDPVRERGKHIAIAKVGIRLGRSAWGYVQMCRFWNTKMWEHPATRRFETIMRIDTDSCFRRVDATDVTESDARIPELSDRYVYQSFHNFESMRGGSKYLDGLFEFAVDYVERENIVPSYPWLWDKIKTVWERRRELISFKTNIEISRRSFFQRPDVRKWHEALSEKEPFGMLRYRWGDAQTRAMTIALFATEETVLLHDIPGYIHGRGFCKKYYEVGGKHNLDNAFSVGHAG